MLRRFVASVCAVIVLVLLSASYTPGQLPHVNLVVDCPCVEGVPTVIHGDGVHTRRDLANYYIRVFPLQNPAIVPANMAENGSFSVDYTFPASGFWSVELLYYRERPQDVTVIARLDGIYVEPAG